MRLSDHFSLAELCASQTAARLGIADPYAAPPAQKRPAPKPRVKRRKQP